MTKKSKIDWDNIKIRIVKADPKHSNAENPYARLSNKERETVIIATSAKIWARHIQEKLNGGAKKDKSPTKNVEPTPTEPTKPALTPPQTPPPVAAG